MPARRQATKKDSTATIGLVAKHLTPHGMAVPPENRKAIPEYIKDYVSLNQFAA